MVVDSGALRGVRHGFVAVLAVGSARCWPAPGCSPRSPSGPNTWPPHRAIRRSTAAPAPAGARQVVDITGMIITADALRRLRVGAQINPVTALEVVGEVVDQSLVEVVPVQVRYGGLYLDHPVADSRTLTSTARRARRSAPSCAASNPTKPPPKTRTFGRCSAMPRLLLGECLPDSWFPDSDAEVCGCAEDCGSRTAGRLACDCCHRRHRHTRPTALPMEPHSASEPSACTRYWQ